MRGCIEKGCIEKGQLEVLGGGSVIHACVRERERDSREREEEVYLALDAASMARLEERAERHHADELRAAQELARSEAKVARGHRRRWRATRTS